jgi:hypothetical protein
MIFVPSSVAIFTSTFAMTATRSHSRLFLTTPDSPHVPHFSTR